DRGPARPGAAARAGAGPRGGGGAGGARSGRCRHRPAPGHGDGAARQSQARLVAPPDAILTDAFGAARGTALTPRSGRAHGDPLRMTPIGTAVLRSSSRFLGLLLATLLVCGRALAAGVGYIRETAIESTLRSFYTPILLAAGLEPPAVHIYIVNDAGLNSFVAGGQNIFINTGTIMRSETPNQLIGIVAHETGHIAGGHLIRSEEAMKDATIKSIIAMVLGAGAAAASHNAGAIGGTMAAAEGVGLRSYLSFSVAQEANADQAALRYLDKTHQSSRGLLEFFQILEGQEILTGQRQSPYLRTHPLTSQRIEYVRQHVEQSPYSNIADSSAWVELHKRMKAKLIAFLYPPAQALQYFPETDMSVSARYGRAIA